MALRTTVFGYVLNMISFLIRSSSNQSKSSLFFESLNWNILVDHINQLLYDIHISYQYVSWDCCQIVMVQLTLNILCF